MSWNFFKELNLRLNSCFGLLGNNILPLSEKFSTDKWRFEFIFLLRNEIHFFFFFSNFLHFPLSFYHFIFTSFVFISKKYMLMIKKNTKGNIIKNNVPNCFFSFSICSLETIFSYLFLVILVVTIKRLNNILVSLVLGLFYMLLGKYML